MIELLTLFIATFFFVFLKSFQQRNVAFDKYLWIVPTSMLMAVTEAYVIFKIATTGHYSIPLVLAWGLGAGFGSLSATLLHKKIFIKDTHD